MSQYYFSIIIPSYNRATIIPTTLDSILAQEFKDWECFVVDDHSSDNTEEVVRQYTDKDCRFHYLKNERKKGAQGARNTGLYHCQSDWVIFFDSDNVMHPDMLCELSKHISDDVDVVQCFSRVVDVNTKEQRGTFNWRSYGNIHNQLFNHQTYVDFNQAIIRKSKLIEIGGLDEDCPSMQEWDTHIRLSRIARYTTVEKPLLDYYVGGKDAISTDTKREVRGRMYILRKHIWEWRKNRNGYVKFIWQIEQFIARNSDETFKKDAYKQLRNVAWDAYYIWMLKARVRGKLSKLYHALQ